MPDPSSLPNPTNWERLNNAPLPLDGASAVQWNDGMFILTSNGTALFYQVKIKLWSMLPGIPNNMSKNISLVNYRGQILTVNKNSEIVAFDASSSSWKPMPKQPREPSYIALRGDTLWAIGTESSYYTDYHAMFSLTTEGWKENGRIEEEKISKLLPTSEYIFQESSGKIIRHQVAKEEEDTTSKEIAYPPYKGFTLHVIKDTLFSFGGRDEDNQPTSDVLRYNKYTDTWDSAGYMRSSRYNAAVTTMQQSDTTEVYVLGGELGSSKLPMQLKLNTCKESKKDEDWTCSTSIVEKCSFA